MVERWATVVEPSGLHARLAARIVQQQRNLAARVMVEYEGRRADAGSLTALLLLGAGGGARVRLLAKGEGAQEALERIRAVLEHAPLQAAYPGVGVSPGVGVGRAYLSSEDAWSVTVPLPSTTGGDEVDPSAERERLDGAIRRGEAQLAALEAWAQREVGGASDILRAERALLTDAGWRAPLEAGIRAGLTAEAAVRAAGGAPLPSVEEGGPQDGLREVLHDVTRRVLRSLAHQELAGVAEPGAGAEAIVLVARQASPSELLEWPRERLAGVAAAFGGAHAHAALIARALGVPMVVGIGESLIATVRAETLGSGSAARPLLRVDGTHGIVTRERSDVATVVPQRRPAVAAEHVVEDAGRPNLLANADTPEDVRRALAAGAEGIGLARTERLFLGRELPPDEEEQYRALEALAEACAGRPLTLRLADLGGGKTPPYLLPLLGASALHRRGAALLAWSAALARPHLRAVARVVRNRRATVMVPMVATRDEWLGVLARWREATEAVGARAALSLLVEAPATALALDDYLAEADEVALGTNDLAALLFGGDRERGEAVWRPLLQPVMLRLLGGVIARARRRGVRVTACGDAAGELPEALVLWGLGVDALSVRAERLSSVGQALGALDHDLVRERTQDILGLSDASEVHERLDEWRRELDSQRKGGSRRETIARTGSKYWLEDWE